MMKPGVGMLKILWRGVLKDMYPKNMHDWPVLILRRDDGIVYYDPVTGLGGRVQSLRELEKKFGWMVKRLDVTNLIKKVLERMA